MAVNDIERRCVSCGGSGKTGLNPLYGFSARRQSDCRICNGTGRVAAADAYRRAVEALDAADKLAEAVLRWDSHVQLEQLTGEYRAARHAAGGR